MIPLAVKYRPQTFEQVIGQDVTVKILQKQITDKNYSHSILFTGNAGCGKTTCARILANQINGEIHEIDCASHNGVADIKDIINEAKIKSLVKDYKVYILDECHTLSSAAWPALLITLENNLPYAIFILCTTDAQKIPNTIISRVQRFNFLPISDDLIKDQLREISSKENITISEDAINVIARSAKGSLRQALTNFDECIMYGDLTKENTEKVLHIVDLDLFGKLTNAIISKDVQTIIDLVNAVYNNGYELHQFVKQYLDYAVEAKNVNLMELLVNIIPEIRYDETPKSIIISRFLTYTPD